MDIMRAIGRALDRMHRGCTQALCRHDYKFAFGKGHTRLRCAKCDRETEGWDLGAMDLKPPVMKFAGDPERHRIFRVDANSAGLTKYEVMGSPTATTLVREESYAETHWSN